MTPVATSHILATNYEQSQEQDIGGPHTHTDTHRPTVRTLQSSV